MTAPIPAHGDHVRIHHGDEVADPFEWLRDKEDPAVIAHLEAENAHTDETLEHLKPLQGAIFDEIRARTLETDLSVPIRSGDWWYLRRTTEGQQYPTFSRVPADGDDMPDLVPGDILPGEELLLDCPALAEGQEFFSLGALAVSDDHTRLAYSVDISGDERFDATVVDIASGDVLDDALRGIGAGLVFSADAAHLYYTRVNDAWRSFQSWRHAVGASADTDDLLLQEDDEKFAIYQGRARTGSHLVIGSFSTTSTEFHLVDLADSAARPALVAARHPDLEYNLEVADDHLLIVHNANHAGFELARAPLGPSEPDEWVTILAPSEGERIESADYFDMAAVVSLRSGGLATVRVVPRVDGAWNAEAAWDITSGGELDTVEVGDNRMADARRLRYELTSLLIPTTICEVDFATREVTVLRETPVPGYDRTAYTERRIWVEAGDGVSIPVSLVARDDVVPDGTNPGHLYGYGSYEVCVDPGFAVSRLSLLDRGVVFAIAHVRGGGEMGRHWYEQGKLLAKRNTFTDFVAVARALVDTGWVAPGRLAAEGGSAGGLLMGAAANLAPDAFRAIVAVVPFVDALTTILDPSLPLTVGEWEEWGDPLHDANVYAYMKGYTPYENIKAAEYPAILAVTSLNDTRVFFVEPAKWVARLRETVTSDQGERPILLRCEMVAGHGGRSGRYDKWRERAEELAFVLDQLGVE